MKTVFEQMIERYTIHTSDDYRNANHEVMQQICLAALYRAKFFDEAAFYGGTCLRIFYGIERFSEDMDFSLLSKQPDFSLEKYFDAIKMEFKQYGREIIIQKKEKTHKSHIESAFLKSNSEIYNIEYRNEKSIKIKLEVDTDPPLQFKTEPKLLLLPYSFMTRCFTIEGLYAGKMHALLFRNWKNRVKGRDWFDFEWYVRKGVSIDFTHLKQRALQSGYNGNEEFTSQLCIEMLKQRIEKTNIQHVLADVSPFVKNTDNMQIWSKDYFMQLADLIKFE